MEEKLNLVERALMSEEEFKKYLGNKADIGLTYRDSQFKRL